MPAIYFYEEYAKRNHFLSTPKYMKEYYENAVRKNLREFNRVSQKEAKTELSLLRHCYDGIRPCQFYYYERGKYIGVDHVFCDSYELYTADSLEELLEIDCFNHFKTGSYPDLPLEDLFRADYKRIPNRIHTIDERNNLINEYKELFQSLTPIDVKIDGDYCSCDNLYQEQAFSFLLNDTNHKNSCSSRFVDTYEGHFYAIYLFLNGYPDILDFGNKQIIKESFQNTISASFCRDNKRELCFCGGDYFIPCFIESLIQRKKGSLLILDIEKKKLYSIMITIPLKFFSQNRTDSKRGTDARFAYYLFNDLKRFFFDSISDDQLKEVFGKYKTTYGVSSYSYAVKAYNDWRNGTLLMAPGTITKFLNLLPPYMSTQQKIPLLKKIIKNEKIYVKVTPKREELLFYWDEASYRLGQLKNTILAAKNSFILPSINYPDNLLDVSWLFDGDMVIAKQIIKNEITAYYLVKFDNAIATLESFRKKSLAFSSSDKVENTASIEVNAVFYNYLIRIIPRDKKQSGRTQMDNMEMKGLTSQKKTNNELSKSISSDDFINQNLEDLSPESRDALVKLALEERIKLESKIKDSELKTVNANNNLDRHIASINSIENRGSKNISHVNTSFEVPDGKMSLDSRTSHCYVATATYQNTNHPNVIILRDYRDRFLRKTPTGRMFIRFYYFSGKYLAILPNTFPAIRRFSKRVIDHCVERIVQKKYKSLFD